MWARSEAGLSRLPVTEKIAGSNPVGPAKKAPHLTMGFFLGKFRMDLSWRGLAKRANRQFGKAQ